MPNGLHAKWWVAYLHPVDQLAFGLSMGSRKRFILRVQEGQLALKVCKEVAGERVLRASKPKLSFHPEGYIQGGSPQDIRLS